ncbi:uncharacterized protein C2orf78-like isoform X2 [Tachyglossus aculeatus]|uniref:uncharacterized protein C2orf78-like isoform X2 n=1 Tax=Tachyglossus aculeatus TaxID=9261 RepID=UPI0018F637DC|nr:uncharacterized protein C2orf78-like isoform X2 [Tachyglossus aculeatus]
MEENSPNSAGNSQGLPSQRITNSCPLNVPAVSRGSSLTGSLLNITQHSIPVSSNAWLLQPVSSVSFNSFPDRDYFFQHSSTSRLSTVAGPSQASISTISGPNIYEWSNARNAEEMTSSLQDCNLTTTSPEILVTPLPMAVQYGRASSAPTMVALYPQWSASLVPRTSFSVTSQRHSVTFPRLPIPHHNAAQAYYYNPIPLGPQLPGQFSPYLQPYGPTPYRASRATPRPGTPQPEMVMVLKEIWPQGTLPLASTPGLYYPASTKQGTATFFQEESVHRDHLPEQSSITLGTLATTAKKESEPLSSLGNISSLVEDRQLLPDHLSVKEALHPKVHKVPKSNSKAPRTDQTSGQATPGMDSSGQPRNNKLKTTEKCRRTPWPKVNITGSQVDERDLLAPVASISDPGCFPHNKKAQTMLSQGRSKVQIPRLKEPKGPRGRSSVKVGIKCQSKINSKSKKKPTLLKRKRKKDHPDCNHEPLKKPRSHLGMQMLQSVQVFHMLGKKSPQVRGISGTRERLGSSSEGHDTGETQPGLLEASTINMAELSDESTDTQSKFPSGEERVMTVPFSNLKYLPSQPNNCKPCSSAVQQLSSPYPAHPDPVITTKHDHATPSAPDPANLGQPVPAKLTQPNFLFPAQTDPRKTSKLGAAISAMPGHAKSVLPSSSNLSFPGLAVPSGTGPSNPTWLGSTCPEKHDAANPILPNPGHPDPSKIAQSGPANLDQPGSTNLIQPRPGNLGKPVPAYNIYSSCHIKSAFQPRPS